MSLGSEAWFAEHRSWKTGSFSGRLARFPLTSDDVSVRE